MKLLTLLLTGKYKKDTSYCIFTDITLICLKTPNSAGVMKLLIKLLKKKKNERKAKNSN